MPIDDEYDYVIEDGRNELAERADGPHVLKDCTECGEEFSGPVRRAVCPTCEHPELGRITLTVSLSALLFAFTISYCLVLLGRARRHDLDACSLAVDGPAQDHAAPSPTPGGGSAGGAGVQSSRVLQGEPDTLLESPEPAPGAYAEPPSIFEGVDGESFQPTAEGLYALSTEQWSQDGFANLTTEEARKLLPIEDDIGTLPTTIFAIVGGFPTHEDCAAAWREPIVRLWQRTYLQVETMLTELQRCPLDHRTAKFDASVAGLAAERDDALLQLYKACDRYGPYKNWAVTHRLFTEWER